MSALTITHIFTLSTPIVAAFTFDPDPQQVGVAVVFTDMSTSVDVPTSWVWNFGDGNTSSTQNPSHAYIANGVYTVILVASNNCNSDTVSHDIHIAAPPVIDDQILPGNCANSSYPTKTITLTEGMAPYTWEIITGALPTGLTLHSDTGVIDGTVALSAQNQTFTFTARVTDYANNTDSKEFSIEVFPLPVWITTPPLPSGNIGVPYSYQLNNPLVDTYLVVSSGFPPGLFLNASGLISRTPITAGSFTFTIRAFSAAGCYTDRTLTLSIWPPVVKPKPSDNIKATTIKPPNAKPLIYQIIGTGLKSPISFDNTHTDRLFVLVDGLAVINQSIHAIIETRRGERYNNPNFGSDVTLRLFEPNDYILKTTLKQDVTEALTRWEKRISLLDVSVINYDDDPRIPDYLVLIIVSYKVNSTHQEGSYVYPFAFNAMPMSEIINKGR